MTTYQRTHIRNANDLRAVADHAGSFFFSPGAMRSFSSRLLDSVLALDSRATRPGARYVFITSEQRDNDTPRYYNVRLMTLGIVRDNRPSVDITTIGPYMAFTSHLDAMRWAAQYVREQD